MPVLENIFNDIFGQNEAIAYLRSSIQSGSIHHAYLFAGPNSVGKKHSALRFAASINCPQKGCGECETCLNVIGLHTEDVTVIEPEGSFITIKQVRSIVEEVGKKPAQLAYKVVIIDDAHLMTVQAANALLRSLEEPPSFRVVFILITTNVNAVLETIRSRCILVNFHPLSDSSVAKYLSEKLFVEPKEAAYIARLYDGIWGNALDIINDRSRLELRSKLLELLMRIGASPKCEIFDLAKEIDDLVTKHAKQKLQVLKAEHDQFLASVKDKVLNTRFRKKFEVEEKRRTRKAERQAVDDIFSVILSWYRDIAVLIQGGTIDNILNIDEAARLNLLAKAMKSKDVVGILLRIEPLSTYMNYNVNRRLLIENLLLEIEEASV